MPHACFKPDDLDDLDELAVLTPADRDALGWIAATADSAAGPPAPDREAV